MDATALRAEIARLEKLLGAKRDLLAAQLAVEALEGSPTASRRAPKGAASSARAPKDEVEPGVLPAAIHAFAAKAPGAFDLGMLVEYLDKASVKYANRNAVSAALSRLVRRGGWVAGGAKRGRYYGLDGHASGADATRRGGTVQPRRPRDRRRAA
jgi:hypothetical protein